MRGPAVIPSSIARLRPKDGPPTSRTVVNPRISVSVASAPATKFAYPTSHAPTSEWGGRTNIVCQCASISPGISVRPEPLIMVVAPDLSTGIGPLEIFSILLPRTRTLVGSESCADFPSNTRTFSKSTVPGCEVCAGAAEARHPTRSKNKPTLFNGVAGHLLSPRGFGSFVIAPPQHATHALNSTFGTFSGLRK